VYGAAPVKRAELFQLQPTRCFLLVLLRRVITPVALRAG